MNYTQQNKPIKLNLDKSRKSLTEQEAFYLLNHERNLSIGKSTPCHANFAACEIDQPEGSNFAVGRYRSPITNELYSWVYNSNTVHYIQRVNSNGECEIVYDGGCLVLSADPEHAIEPFRAYLRVEKICSGRHGKYLVWVNGDNEDIGYLDVEASIATSSFTTPFFDRCEDGCAVLSLCVPKPCGCVTGEFLPLISGESSLTNTLLNIGVKIMVCHEYYDMRASEWSDVSTLFYQDTKGCFLNIEGFPRCLKLRIPLGNPLVEKIKIAHSFDNGANWSLYDTIEKYKPYAPNGYWYERDIRQDIEDSIDPDDECYFFYNYCNNKQTTPIDAAETSRVYNPIPRNVQGILPIKNALGFYNYKSGTCPVNENELRKLSLTLNEVTDLNCEPEMVSVTVRAIIHDFERNGNQFIYRYAGKYKDDDDVTDTALFGGVVRDPIWVLYPDYPFDQHFNGKRRNFIAYIEGTDYWGEMKQYYSEAGWIGRKEVGVLAGSGDEESKLSATLPFLSGGFYYQEHTFKVKKGTQGFIRLCNHHETELNQDSSTFTSGLITDISTYSPFKNLSVPVGDEVYEIYFNACSGDDVELTQSFVISDGISSTSGSDDLRPYGIFGYVKINGVATEKLGIRINGVIEGDPLQATTDHNGFFHFNFLRPSLLGTEVELVVLAEQDCGNFAEIHSETFDAVVDQEIRHDITFNKADYVDNFYTRVIAHVKDCDNLPVGGISIAMMGSKFKITDGSGNATFKARNSINRNRGVFVLLMDKGECFLLDCNDECNPCMSSTILDFDDCFDKTANGGLIKEVVLDDFVVKRQDVNLNSRGLKKGGRYGFAVMLESPCGKISSPLELKYFDMPKIQLNDKLSFPDFSFNISGTMTLPFDGCLKILRTENQNPFELQWVVDKAERVNGKIRLTIQSLNDYNASFNFKTNTVYKYLDGDRVEFIKKGNGELFDIATFGLLNYKTLSPFNAENISGIKDSVDYFNQLLINDDGKFNDNFSDLEGSLIELQRVKDINSDPSYFEICTSIKVVNGHPIVSSGTFSTFDTYLINRTINSFTHTFEHHSPSDFWGERLTDTGKFHAINKYQNELRVGRGISINSPTNFSRFGDLKKVFDAPEQGDIVAMGIKDGRIILAIGENDTFVAQAANDLVRVGGDGLIRALPADAIIGDGEPKVSGAYGCKYQHVGSIYFGDGYATWVEINGSLIKHDYNRAVDVSEGQARTFFRRKVNDFEFHNSGLTRNNLTKYRFCTGYNNFNGCVNITVKKLTDGGAHNSKKLFITSNETISYHPDSNEFTSLQSFTPEGYSSYDMFDGEGCAFISFLNGIPYIHHASSDTYNEFFGVAVDRVVGISINKYPEKEKKAISLELQDNIMWFVSEVTVDGSDFNSEIPPVRMKKVGNKWSASFLGNKNGVGGLFGKQTPNGYCINILLTRNNTDQLKYGTFDNSKRIIYDELDYIFTKFMLLEQSGMTNNV